MNKAITDGLILMPPAFANGLTVWSSGDGPAGSPTYEGAGNAALIASDQDFGGALELLKTDAVQKLRYMGQTTLLPGCYLRIRARVKAVSGNLPSVRIAAYAGGAGGAHVAGVVETGPSVALTTYGEVVTVEAIVGTGTRTGVDMPWGTAALFGHFGLDLTGANGGVVRIDDIEIEDATSVFLRKLMDWVDVRDYGALGDGVTDDRAAFVAADAAAGGRQILVPDGTYHIGSSISVQSRIRFQGTLDMPVAARLSLMQNFDLPSYIEAFGDEGVAFKKAVQALMNFTDHESLDMGGRRIQITAPIDMQAAVDNKTVFQTRRVIRNGQFDAQTSTAWDDDMVTSQATYDLNFPTQLSNVANIAQIKVGSLVTAPAGVGREVYVTSLNVGAGQVFISQPLYDAVGTQTYTFRRFKYMLDFSGFAALDSFALDAIEIKCNGLCSAVMLAPTGLLFQVRDSYITKPKDRGITSIGTGCQGMQLDRNQFLSNEQSIRALDRTSIAFNVNANDVKVRENRAVKFAHFGVMNGTGHMISGNHFFQGDAETNGSRKGGIVLTGTNVKTTITGNYIDNNFIEWGNEHDSQPDQSNEFSFGGLSITDNIFMASSVGPWFRWMIVKPYGAGHFLHGLTVTGNTFRTVDATVDRFDDVDASIAPLDMTRARNILIEGNTFNGITQFTSNPVIHAHTEASPQVTWNVDFAGKLPFGGRARVVSGVMAKGRVTNAAGATVYAQPYALIEQGVAGDEIKLGWPEAVQGTAQVTARIDNPQ